MNDAAKSRSQLLKELEELRDRVATLESDHATGLGLGYEPSETVAARVLPLSAFSELEEAPRPLRIGYETTESIELRSLFTRDVTSSGSFDVRSGIWATTFGKVIQALPIPTFLVDETLRILVANQACGRFTFEYERVQGRPFSSLVGGAQAAARAESLLQDVFADRTPRVGEGTLTIGDAMIWARLTFRPIRILNDRYVLVLVEDLTREKVQLHENERLRRELEHRVERRTAQLRKTNEELMQEIAERKRAEQEKEELVLELREALSQVKKLSGLLPICASCKKIRDDKGYWQQIEGYIRDHSEAEFSHGLCPECAKKLYPEFFKD
jgi:PAS domain-containing protein